MKVKEKSKRVLTNDDIKKYEPMVESYLRNFVLKNWNEASAAKYKGDTPLGNTGFTMNDFRQHLKAEVCVALHNYNPNYVAKNGRSVKESTFVFRHLYNRLGQLLKRLTKKRAGYGVWTKPIEEVMHEVDYE